MRQAFVDHGFCSPGNRARLDEILDHGGLPQKGYLNKADWKREQGDAFVAMGRQHPAVESAINNFGHRGVDRVPAPRASPEWWRSLSVVALNIHRIRLLLCRQGPQRNNA
ncbi:MAG: hypothetical protein OXI81_16390 [Paracoccaceae bacterium]|nr:hypothetical protein [Paracoccaceae bacterium]